MKSKTLLPNIESLTISQLQALQTIVEDKLKADSLRKSELEREELLKKAYARLAELQKTIDGCLNEAEKLVKQFDDDDFYVTFDIGAITVEYTSHEGWVSSSY